MHSFFEIDAFIHFEWRHGRMYDSVVCCCCVSSTIRFGRFVGRASFHCFFCWLKDLIECWNCGHTQKYSLLPPSALLRPTEYS